MTPSSIDRPAARPRAHLLLLTALVVALFAFAARAQGFRAGPVPAGDRIAGELAPLSVDHAGAPDVLWRESYVGRPATLPAQPSVVVRLTLPDGREWSADVGSAPGRVVDGGKLSTTTLHWAQLERRGERPLLGAHLFVERRCDGVTLLSLAISNAALDLRTPTSFAGGVYFRELSVEVGRGILLPEVLRAGERRDGARRIVLASGNHYFPGRAHLNRRYALTPNPPIGARGWIEAGQAALELAGLDLPATFEHFGGAKLTLPQIDRDAVERAAAARLGRMRGVLAAGSVDPPSGLRSGLLGPFAPAGWDVAGAVGGDGIELLPGWDATRSSALLRRLAHDLEAERHPVALYDAATGDPVVRLPIPCDYRLTRGFGKVTSLPWTVRPASDLQYDDRRVARDWNTGTCAYRAALLAYQPHDGQHLVRATRNAEAAWWLGRDWLARLDLEMIAADARYAWTLHPAAPSGGYVPPGLSVALQVARTKPGQGNPALGREFGWVAHSWAIDLAAAGGLTSRDEKLAHARGALELGSLVAMPTGITQRLSHGSFYGSPDPWVTDGMPTSLDVSQWVLEMPIVSNGVLGLSRVAVAPDNGFGARARWIVAQSARSAYCNPAIAPQPTPWNAAVRGIPKWAGVATKGGAVATAVTVAKGGADPSNSWHHIALAWEASGGERVLLDAMNRLGSPVADRAARLASFGRTELSQTAAAVSALQREGGR